jgi:tRNA-Thr(GGU) m(6)t(6)A37 methyltransferase TsaA
MRRTGGLLPRISPNRLSTTDKAQRRPAMKITYTPIGTIHTPFTDLSDMPIQPASEASAPGTVLLDPRLTAGLKDLDGFSHVILIYHFHRAGRVDLTVTPFMDAEPRGLFATRAPTRPNPIGISIVALERVEGNILHLGNVDILDGTPLLDIKPYVPSFDAPPDARTGWLEQAGMDVRTKRSDDRFR